MMAPRDWLDDNVDIWLEMVVHGVRLSVRQKLNAHVWRDAPLLTLETHVRDMLTQIIPPAVAAFDNRVPRQSVTNLSDR